MNKLLALTVLLAVATLVAQAAPPSATYSTKYDNLDVDAIISNERALLAYAKCMVDEGPCSPEGREFRKNLPDALSTNCAKCTDAQKTIIRKLSKSLIDHHPKEWEKIKNKFDPKGEHHDAFTKFLKGEV